MNMKFQDRLKSLRIINIRCIRRLIHKTGFIKQNLESGFRMLMNFTISLIR